MVRTVLEVQGHSELSELHGKYMQWLVPREPTLHGSECNHGKCQCHVSGSYYNNSVVLDRSDDRSNELTYKTAKVCQDMRGLPFFSQLSWFTLTEFLRGSSSGRVTQSRGVWWGGRMEWTRARREALCTHFNKTSITYAFFSSSSNLRPKNLIMVPEVKGSVM